MSLPLHDVDNRNPYQLAMVAGCETPASLESPGALFLLRIQDAVREVIDENGDRDDLFEQVDSAVPIGTWELWRTFVDLAAWQAFDDYREDSGTNDVSNAHGDGMTAQAAVALFTIGERLADQLFEEREDNDDEEDS